MTAVVIFGVELHRRRRSFTTLAMLPSFMCITILVVLCCHSATAQHPEMRPFIDQYRDILLSPLQHLPPKTCQSREERKGHLLCCIHTCQRQPFNLVLDPVIDDYYIDCSPDRRLDCSILTRDMHIASMRRELEPRKEVIPKDRWREMLARVNPFELTYRFAKWYAKLVFGWFLSRSLTRGLALIKQMMTTADAAAAAAVRAFGAA